MPSLSSSSPMRRAYSPAPKEPAPIAVSATTEVSVSPLGRSLLNPMSSMSFSTFWATRALARCLTAASKPPQSIAPVSGSMKLSTSVASFSCLRPLRSSSRSSWSVLGIVFPLLSISFSHHAFRLFLHQSPQGVGLLLYGQLLYRLLPSLQSCLLLSCPSLSCCFGCLTGLT